jgi:tetratricopeptide (TPR) repeat protein
VTLGHEVEELVSMTDVVALMGDAYKALGDEKMAAEHFREAAELAGYASHPHQKGQGHRHGTGKQHGHPLDRQYARYAADHGIDLDNALKAAKEDLRQRQDIFGWDTIAWVHHKRGEADLAEAAIRKALRTGTKDMAILTHRNLIRRKRLERAPEIALVRKKAAPF